MARAGYIHDKLDIKFLVLYIMSRVAAPIELPVLADLTMCDAGVDYFDFAEATAELVESEHLLLNSGLYDITDKGKKNGAICESSLPYSIRIKCDKSLARLNSRIRRNAQVRSELIAREGGSYTLRLALDDEDGNLMTLDLLTASQTQAERLAEQFKTHPEQIYNGILGTLLADYDEKE